MGYALKCLSIPLLKSRWVGLWLAVSVLAVGCGDLFGPDEEGIKTF